MAVHKYTCKTNSEWREKRCHSVGASAVGTIFGLNKFQTPEQLQKKMKDELNGIFDYSETAAMQRGHYYEGGVAKWFSDLSHHEIIGSSSAEFIVTNDLYPHLHVSPDRYYWISKEGVHNGSNADQNKGILECKTTTCSVQITEIPAYWLLQVQTLMGVNELFHAALAWDVLGDKKGLQWSYVQYEPLVFIAIAEVCDDFWRRCIVGNGDPRPASELRRLYPCVYDYVPAKIKDPELRETADLISALADPSPVKKPTESIIHRIFKRL